MPRACSLSNTHILHFIFFMPPTLVDPLAGVEGAAAYLDYWGMALYVEWCKLARIDPVPYAEFRARTLRRGRDWWTDDRE